MAEFVDDEKLNQGGTEPRPLSSEAPASAEIEIDPKKKPSDKKTIINFRNNDYIRKTVETPKEPAAQNVHQPPASAASSKSPSDNVDDIKKRLNSESQEPQALSSSAGGGGNSDAEAPDQEDCDMYAEMAIELIDWLMIMLIQWYAKDQKEDDYRSDEKKKTRLKKMLGKMLMKMGKKYPIAVFFFGALILMYVPAARKAHAHKQKVEEERAEQEAKAAAESESRSSRSGGDSGSGGSKRRRLKQDPEIQDANLEND